MAPPVTYKTVTGTYLSPAGTPVAGSLRFIPAVTVLDPADHVVVPPLPVTVALDGSGAFSVQLMVTDDPATSPVGWVWSLDEDFAGGRKGFTFQLPSAGGSTVQLADVLPADAVDVTHAYASQASVQAFDERITASEAAVDAAIGAAGVTVAAAVDAAEAAASAAAGAVIHDYAAPGRDVPALVTSAPVSVSSGPATVVAGPSSGRRIVKELWLSGPSGASLTLTLAGVTISSLRLRGGVLTIPSVIPVAPGENLQATVTDGPVVIMPSYADRSDTLVDRLGLASGSASGTLIASVGTDRVITQLWVAATSLSVTATASIAIGGTTIVPAVAIAGGGLTTHDDPIGLPAGTAVTWTGDSATAVTYMAAGRTA